MSSSMRITSGQNIDTELYNDSISRLQSEIKRIKFACQGKKSSENSPYTFGWVPFDEESREKIWQLAQSKRVAALDAIVIIGIGGSNLGAQAIWQALSADQLQEGLRVFWLDALDPDEIVSVQNRLQNCLKGGQQVEIVVISKSGGTLETSLNAACTVELLKKHRPNTYYEYITCITDKNSSLAQLAHKEKYACLYIPYGLGGRYSVFSAVGLFPLALMGVDINALCEGACQATRDSCQKGEENIACQRAITLYNQLGQGVNIHTLFVFDKAFEGIGKWYRQLMAESLGKQKVVHEKTVRVGMTPEVAVGTTDLHSMIQLYLAGPCQRYTTFYRVTSHAGGAQVPTSAFSEYNDISLGELRNIILQGVCAAYEGEGLAYETLHIFKQAYHLGYLLQLHMCEIIYLGHLMQINPFNQPQVELYKQHVRKMLQE